MKYKCVIIDDEALARDLLEAHVSQLTDLELVGSCASAIEAAELVHQGNIDLLFLDIEMPVLRGTDFLKGLVHPPKVIFTTAYRDYALDGFELDAVDYLLKPIVFERFFKAFQKFRDRMSNKADTLPQTNPSLEKKGFLFVGKLNKQVKIVFDDILFIESIKDYIKIHLTDGELIIKQGITAFQAQLDSRFLRVHRSFIINRDKVTAYTKSEIEVKGQEIPIGGNYKAVVVGAFF